MRGTILWENPNPTKALAAQDIMLSADDYDYYEVFFRNTNIKKMSSIKAIKGYDAVLFILGSYRRDLVYKSDTVLSVENAIVNNQINNESCVPIKIIGYKS